MDYQLKDELEDGTEDRSESDPSLDPLDPFITLLHHKNETKETGGIRGDDDDEHTGTQNENISLNEKEEGDQYNDIDSYRFPLFEEKEEAHVQTQHDSNNDDLTISSHIKASTNGMNQTDEENVISATPQLEQETMTTLPVTFNKIYRSFESIFTAYSNPRMGGGGGKLERMQQRHRRQHRWPAKDIIETLASQKRLYTEYFNVLRDYKTFFSYGEGEDVEDGSIDNQRKFNSGTGGHCIGVAILHREFFVWFPTINLKCARFAKTSFFDAISRRRQYMVEDKMKYMIATPQDWECGKSFLLAWASK
eukprot:504890_1